MFWLSTLLMLGAVSPEPSMDAAMGALGQTALEATPTDLTGAEETDGLATPTDFLAATEAPTAAPTPEPTPQPLAEDITMDSALNGYTGDKHPTNMRDGSYKTYWESSLREGVHSLRITAPKGKLIGGLLIRWKTWPVALTAQVQVNNQWIDVGQCDGDFVVQYFPLSGVHDVRIISRDDSGRTKLEISEITVLTPGKVPEDIPVFRKAPDKVDLLLASTHPDDEVLWFGGLLATYAGEQDKDVLVSCAAHNSYYRRLELCDCLWAMGVDIYPNFMNYVDSIANGVTGIYEVWGGHKRVQNDLVALYRQYKPDVLVLQAVDGESGHPAHKALSQAGREAVGLAASAEEFPESAEAYGTWDVPKVYVHLWEENQITMDWHVPLERFGGLDGMEVARNGYSKHTSQQEKSYYSVHDGGDTDCSLFGLFHSTVGPDVEKNDLFENIPARGE